MLFRSTCRVKNKKGSVISDSDLAKKIDKLFDLRPYSIIKRFGLKNPIFEATAAYGHFGRDPYTKEIEVCYPVKGSKARKNNGGNCYAIKAEFFAWEKLDMVEAIRREFGL